MDASALPTPDEQAQQKQLDFTQGFVADQSPEEAAAKLRPAESKPSWAELVRSSPVLAARLSKPEKAAPAQDDVPALQGIERFFGGWRDVPRATTNEIKRGKLMAELADLGLAESEGRATPEQIAKADEIEAAMEAIPSTRLGLVTGVPAQVAQSLPLQIQGMLRTGPEVGLGMVAGGAAGAAAGAPAGGVGAIPGAVAGAKAGASIGFTVGNAKQAGMAEQGLAYREFKKLPGATPETARAAAQIIGVVNGALEILPTEVLFKGMGGGLARRLVGKPGRDLMKRVLSAPTFKNAAARFSGRMAMGAVTEGVTEFLQEIDTILGGRAISEETASKAFPWGRAVEAGVGGAQGGAGFAFIPTVAEAYADLNEVAKAKDRQAFFTELGKLSTDSKLRERLPEEFKAYVDEINAKYGAVDSVSIPAESLTRLFQLEEIDPDAVSTEIGRQLAGAFGDPQTEIVIPIADFAAQIAPLKNAASILGDIRVKDELTGNEAKEVERRAKQILKDEAGKLTPEDADPVHSAVKQMLTDVGIATDTASKYAALWSGFINSRAARLQTDPMEYLKGVGLNVAASDLVAVIAQDAGKTLTPEQLKIVDEATKSGDNRRIYDLLDEIQTDDLTGGANQGAFARFVGGFDEQGKPKAPQAGFWLQMDLNDLKKANDVFGGHPAGNAYLRAMGAAVGPAVRANQGRFFRSGGDELTAWWPKEMEGEARKALEAVREAIAKAPTLFEGKFRGSVSAGLGGTFEAADVASYEAKKEAVAAGRSGSIKSGLPADLSKGDFFFKESPSLKDDLARAQVLNQPIGAVETPAFKKWFKDSKVVDENGAPLVVYHGTTHDFDRFEINGRANPENYHGRGFYFTSSTYDVGRNYGTHTGPDLTQRIEALAEQILAETEIEGDTPAYGSPEYREMYARAKAEAASRLAGPGPNVMPVYLSIQNPVIVQKKGGTRFDFEVVEEEGYDPEYRSPLLDAFDKVARTFQLGAATEGLRGRIVEMLFNGATAWEVEDTIRRTADIDDFATNDDGTTTKYEFIRALWEETGFDGIILDATATFANMGLDEGTVHYVPFKPNQIKSAIGNRGTFSSRSTNILYQPTEVEGFFSAAVQAVEGAKQLKGDAKSWWSVISKTPGVKKEELEWMGLKAWLDAWDTVKGRLPADLTEDELDALGMFQEDFGAQDEKIRGIITKDQVLKYVKAHRVEIHEEALGGTSTLSTEERDEALVSLLDLGVSASYSTRYDEWRFSYCGYADAETSDFDTWLQDQRNSGNLSRKTEATLEALLKEATELQEQGEDISDKVQELNDALDGIGGHFSDDLTFAGYISEETEFTDIDEIETQLRESQGSRTAEEFRELADKLNGGAGSSRHYEGFSLKKGQLEIPGTGRELLFYVPQELKAAPPLSWKAPHFDDQGKGLLAHARIAEHEIDGQRVLFIEEIQSDRMQQAREAKRAAVARMKELEKKIKEFEARVAEIQAAQAGLNAKGIAGSRAAIPDRESWDAECAKVVQKWKEEIAGLKKRTGFDSVAAIEKRLEEVSQDHARQQIKYKDPVSGRSVSVSFAGVGLRDTKVKAAREIMSEMVNADEAVVDAPLKTVWEEFVVKRLLMYAAEQGLNAIAWTTGEQQNVRWSQALREKVDEIRWVKDGGNLRLSFFQNGTELSGGDIDSYRDTPLAPAKAEQVIGGEMVKSILADPRSDGAFKGDDIQVGGEGFRFYYNQSMPSIFEKLLKAHGAAPPVKVEHTGLRDKRTVSKVQIKGATWKELGMWVANAIRAKLTQIDEWRDAVSSTDDFGKLEALYEDAQKELADQADERVKAEGEVADLANPTEEELERIANRGPWYVNHSRAKLKEFGGFSDAFWDDRRAELRASIEALEARGQAYRAAADFVKRDPRSGRSNGILLNLDSRRSNLKAALWKFEGFSAMIEDEDSFDSESATIPLNDLRDGLWGSGYNTYGRSKITAADIRDFVKEQGLTIPEWTSDVLIATEESEINTPGEQVWKVEVPPSFVADVKKKGLPLYQPDKGGKDFRGSTEFDDARRWFKITLTGKANLSTFLHESGHAFLELLHRDASQGHAQSLEDINAIYNWLGAKQGEKLSRSQLERFARGFERYLMEGRAPSSKLEAAFAAFKSWLVFIYRTLARLDAPLTDEVRAVMDRLVATDEEIQKYQQANQPMPPTPGMTPTQHRAYLTKWQKAVGTRQAAAEARALRELHTAMRDARRNIQAQVEQEAKGRKDFNAWEILSRGRTLDGSLIPLDIEDVKLDAEALPERKFKSITKKGGMDPDAAAPYLGYKSGADLVRALSEMPARTKWVKEETLNRMREKYPEIELSEIAPKALKALHEGGDVAKVLGDELAAIDRALGTRMDRLEIAAIHRAARMQVAEMSQQEMQPGRLLRRELALAKEVEKAIKKGDFNAARGAKQQQLLNHFLYSEVAKAVDEIDAIKEYLSRFDEMAVRRRVGKAGGNYLEAIDALLEGVEFKRQTNSALERRASLEQYLTEMEADGDVIAIPPKLRAEVGLVNFRQMKLDDLRALRDSVKNLESQARLKNRLFDGKRERDFRKTTASLAANIHANLGTKYLEPIGEQSWWAKGMEWMRQGRADLTKVEFMCRALDGGKTAGLAHELIFQPLVDAQARKMELSKKVTEQLMTPFRNLTLKERLRFDTAVDFMGHKLKVREVIAVALNMGNEGNRMKLLKGFGWEEDATLQALERILKPSDLDLIEHFWTTIDTLRPEIASLSKRVTGIEPEWVQPSPFKIGGRTLKGGYYPIVYNRRLSHKGEQIAQRKTGDVWENNFLLPAVEKGFTESRTQFFAPVLLSLDVIPSHINEVVHYLTHYEAVRAVDRITQSKVVREALTDGLGREQYNLIRPWLQAIAADGVVHEQTDFIDRTLRRLRLGSSIALLGFKVTTGLKQVFGVSSTAKELGVKYTGVGIKLFMEKLAKGRAFADVDSAEFQNLDAQHDRDMAQMFERMTSGFSEFGHLKSKMAHFSLAWMMLNQKVVNAITWYGAMEKALDEGHPRPADYANSVVRMTQSGGGVKDLAAIQRGSETKRMFVTMYSYFSVLANQLIEPINKRGAAKLPVLAARWWWLVTLPVVLDMLSSGAKPDGGDEPEDYLRQLAVEQARYAGRSIPLGGTLLDAMLSDRQTRYGAWLDTLVKGAASAGRTARAGGDVSESTVKSLVDLLGAGAGLPTGAAKNAWSYFDQFDTMDEPIQNLLFRPPSEWE